MKLTKFLGFFAILPLTLSCDLYNSTLDQEILDEPKEEETPFEVEMTKTVASINEVATNECLILNILTDNHISSQARNQQANNATIDNLTSLNQRVHSDGVVHMGDIIAQSLETSNGFSDDTLYTIMSDYMQKLSRVNPHVFFINGNHDGKKANRFYQDRWLDIATPIQGDYIKRHSSAPYFYYDFPEKKVRCVFLALPDCYPNPTSAPIYGYTNRLLEWLKDEALAVNDGTDVILFGHIPVFHANYITNGIMQNRETFEAMCRAFNDHTAYKDKNIEVDFTKLTNSRILCYISGHAHSDLIAEPGWSYEGTRIVSASVSEPFTYNNNMPCHVVVIGRNSYDGDAPLTKTSNGGVVYARNSNDASMDLWDTMVYNPRTRTIHFIRFGAGVDRTIELQ